MEMMIKMTMAPAVTEMYSEIQQAVLILRALKVVWKHTSGGRCTRTLKLFQIWKALYFP